jgi:hypothetical protein
MRSLMVAATLALAPAAGAGDAAGPLAALAWMVGGWASEQDGTASEEHWVAARGGTMLGLHRDVKGGRTVGFEFLRIEAQPEGLVYLASPSGRPATPFRAVEVGADRVVFENKAHDFPQRILYWRSPGALHARIEGVMDGKASGMEWRWRAAPPYGREK